MPLCDTRLVTVRNGRSATPNFHFKTFSGFDAAGNALPAGAGVPLPGRIFGIAVDDLNLSINPKELFYGEKYGIPNLPIGIYDFSNRLVKTIQTDPQGAVRGHPALDFQLQLPAAGRSVPGHLPLPGERSRPARASEPGLQPGLPHDRRLLRGVAGRQPALRPGADAGRVRDREPGTQQTHPAACLLNDPAQPTAPKVPELFAINKPFVRNTRHGRGAQHHPQRPVLRRRAGTVTRDQRRRQPRH